MTRIPEYVAALPKARAAATAKGYALTVHGSEARDLDLVAVPWTAKASAAKTLVDAICSAVGGSMKPGARGAAKPHGRRAWKISLTGALYIDLSVMPLRKAKNPPRPSSSSPFS